MMMFFVLFYFVPQQCATTRPRLGVLDDFSASSWRKIRASSTSISQHYSRVV
jgi:hypothetical protein